MSHRRTRSVQLLENRCCIVGILACHALGSPPCFFQPCYYVFLQPRSSTAQNCSSPACDRSGRAACANCAHLSMHATQRLAKAFVMRHLFEVIIVTGVAHARTASLPWMARK
mmetsp:Transcript_109515/g.275485  ORF Transcript_109515/g.275485 Transcript_109515/m.275485 type:complete len:112 (+) Transcript_109515:395-730(+)